MAAVNETSYILENSHNQQGRYSITPDDTESTEDTKKLFKTNGNEENESSLPLASFNFINSIIGSGVIGIPYALHQAGFGFGLILLVVVALLTDYSLILMVRSGHLCGVFSYQGLMESAFGKPGFILLSVLQFTYPFIAMVSYNVIVGDTITKVLLRVTGASTTSLFVRREFIIALACIFVIIPLCLYRNISRLAKVSFLSLVFVTFILVAIFIRLGTLSTVVPQSSDSWKFINSDIVPAVGIMVFAFMCHHNTFLLYGSIRDADQRQWDTVTHASVFISFIISLLFGIAGYSTFTGSSQGDLMENYCWDDDLMNFSRILFSITILLTFPIECFVTREVIENTLLLSGRLGLSDNQHHIIITLTIIAITYLLSLSTDCLGIVLELNGVIAAVPLAYILPAASYLKLQEGSIFSRSKLPALFLALIGFLVVITGIFQLIVHFNEIDKCSHGKVMPYCYTNDTHL